MSNKVADALRRVNLILHEFQVNGIGFDDLKDICKDDVDFKYANAAYESLVSRDQIPWLDYMIQEGMLFKSNKVFILRCSMRENLLKENHIGGLVGHFGQDKKFSQLNAFYFWPGMQCNVKIFVEICRVCQHAKGKSQNVVLYQPFPIPNRPWDFKYGVCIRIAKKSKR